MTVGKRKEADKAPRGLNVVAARGYVGDRLPGLGRHQAQVKRAVSEIDAILEEGFQAEQETSSALRQSRQHMDTVVTLLPTGFGDPHDGR
jgi:hypothetical protein